MTLPDHSQHDGRPKKTTETLSWVQALAQSVSRLSEDQLISLASALRSNPTTLLTSGRLQRILSISTTEASQLARTLETVVVGRGNVPLELRDVAIALEALSLGRSDKIHIPPTIEVVCTSPFRLGVAVRSTFATAIEMVRGAHEEILVVGYLFTEGARGLIEQLAIARRDRGVRVTFIGNRMQEHISAVRSIWPADTLPPKIFSREANPNDATGVMHAKLLICDGTAALVTSANFSRHGLHENIEIGVKIQSHSVARLVEFVQAMIRTKEIEKVTE